MHWAKIRPSSSLSPGCVVWLVSLAPSTRKSEAGACSSCFRPMIWGAVRLQTCWSSQGALLATKRRREKALKVLTFWQSAQPIETLSFIYIRCLASSPDSRTVAVKSVWEMRTRSPLSARDEWQKSWVLQCLFQKNLFSLFFSAFFTETPSSSRQSHSQFPLAPVSWSTSCKRNSSGMQLKGSLHGSASGKKGVRGAAWNGEWRSLPPSLSLSRSVTLSLPLLTGAQSCSCLRTQPITPWQQTERECDRITLFHARETHIALFSQSWKYDSHKDTHKRQNAGHFRVVILLNFTC